MGIAEIGCCVILMGPGGFVRCDKVSCFSWFLVRGSLLASVVLDALKWDVEACGSLVNLWDNRLSTRIASKRGPHPRGAMLPQGVWLGPLLHAILVGFRYTQSSSQLDSPRLDSMRP